MRLRSREMGWKRAVVKLEPGIGLNVSRYQVWIGTKTFVFCFLNLVVLSDVSTLIVFSLFFYFLVH